MLVVLLGDALVVVAAIILVASDKLGYRLLNLAHNLAILIIQVLLLKGVISRRLLIAIAIIGVPRLLALNVGRSSPGVESGVHLLELDVLASCGFR